MWLQNFRVSSDKFNSFEYFYSIFSPQLCRLYLFSVSYITPCNKLSLVDIDSFTSSYLIMKFEKKRFSEKFSFKFLFQNRHISAEFLCSIFCLTFHSISISCFVHFSSSLNPREFFWRLYKTIWYLVFWYLVFSHPPSFLGGCPMSQLVSIFLSHFFLNEWNKVFSKNSLVKKT